MKYYFPHEYNARNDRKLKLVRNKFGSAGKELYWDLVEMLYCEDGYLPVVDIPVIADDYKVTPEFINDLLNLDIGEGETLFQRNETHFWNDSVLKRIETIKKLSETNRRNAQNRWELYNRNANAEQTHSEEKKEDKPKKTKKAEKNKKEFVKFSEFEFVNLTQDEYDNLKEKHGEKELIEAIGIFDTWLSKKGKTAKQYIGKPHYNHFRKDGWMWGEVNKCVTKTKVGSTDYASLARG